MRGGGVLREEEDGTQKALDVRRSVKEFSRGGRVCSHGGWWIIPCGDVAGH